MDAETRDIAASFDARAGSYNANEWHRACAEQLVAFSGIASGQRVLDAGTGTGFAAVAAARAAGPSGRVVAIDLSEGMLAVARLTEARPGAAPVEWVQDNAVTLPRYPSATFDVVLCAAALLYMPVPVALAEWHRLLKRGGIVAFSSMKAGFPVAGRLFRECAARLGIQLDDPSAPLGFESACHAALRNAGFAETVVTSGSIAFSPQDISVAWDSNLASPAHASVRALDAGALAQMRSSFERDLAREEQEHPGATTRADVLFAKGVR